MLNFFIAIALSAGSTTGVKPGTAAPRGTIAVSPIRISIDIDGAIAFVTIPADGPALIEHVGWTKSLAIVVAARSGDGSARVSIALIPADTTNDKTSNADVIKTAVVTKSIATNAAVELVPGKDIAVEVFGKTVPKRLAIQLAAKH